MSQKKIYTIQIFFFFFLEKKKRGKCPDCVNEDLHRVPLWSLALEGSGM